jgi:hypothetical protein
MRDRHRRHSHRVEARAGHALEPRGVRRATGIGQVEIVPREADVSAIVGSCERRPKNESRLE